MSNKNKIEITLKKLILKEKREFVAMISGEWGIGKTHFWNEFKDKNLQNKKKVVYISLFGLNSLDEIKNEVIFQLSKYTKTLNKYRDRIKSLKGGSLKVDDIGLSIGGAVINATLSLFSTTDFEDIVICFDDFERLSSSVSLKDVMGLISQFKEQKKCKIVMILNEAELDKLSDIDGKKHNEIFALYKEKIIDYNFFFKPSFEELFAVVKEDVKYFNSEWVEVFFQKADLQNLRIMKQVIFQLNHFKFIKAYHLDDRVLQEFVEIALNIFIFYAKSSSSYEEFLKLQEYSIEKLYKKDINIIEDYENKLDMYMETSYYKNKNDIEAIVYEFIENYMFEKEKLQLLLTQNNLNLEYYQIQDKLSKIIDKMDFDFQSNLIECSSEIYTILNELRDSITSILNIDNFYFYISKIKEHIKIDDDFEDNIIKKYLKEQPERVNRHRDTYELFITKFYPYLLEYLKEQDTLKLMENLEATEIISLFQKVDSAWSPSDCFILGNLDHITYKNNIIEYPIFFKELINFIQRHYYTNDFSEAVKNIKTALIELHNQNKDYDWRIKRMFNNQRVSWDEFISVPNLEKKEAK